MEKTLISLAGSGESVELSAIVNDMTNEEIESVITKCMRLEDGSTTEVIRAIFKGSRDKTEKSQMRTEFVYNSCIQILQSNELRSKANSEIIGILLQEIDYLPSSMVIKLTKTFLNDIKSADSDLGKSLDLFPKLLSTLSEQEAVSYNEDEMSGLECKNTLIKTLCSSRWHRSHVIHLANMFRDVQLSQEELRSVLNKILGMLGQLDMQELPPIVYQLLLLSSKGHRKLVIERICTFFIDRDIECARREEQQGSSDLMEVEEDSSEALHHTEGTVMLHITFAIKQDQDLGREYVKFLKVLQQCSPMQLLAPFSLAMALSTARIHRFQEQVYEILKSSILKSYKDDEKKTQNNWAREMIPDMEDVSILVEHSIENSKAGWDQVTQGLVELGFNLMDSFGPRSVFGRVTEAVAQSAVLSPNQKAANLGSLILLNTFKAHKVVRPEILEQILNRVVTKTSSPVSHFIELLSTIVKSFPQIVLECQLKVREAFDYLGYLPSSSADGLLKALQPLFKISISLKDSLLLVLRKAMFSRQVEARIVAVHGFLLVLRNFKVMGGLPSSQSFCSSQESTSSQLIVDIHVHTSQNPNSNEALCLEILGNLRRCFTHQADVRLALYEGFYDVISRNSKICHSVIDILLFQMKKYFEMNEDVMPPLRLGQCVITQGDKTYLAEPLGHLVSCIHQCLVMADKIEDEQSDEDIFITGQADLKAMMTSIAQRMIKGELEDFELDKSSDYSLGNSTGVKNTIFAILVIGLYEVFMEHSFIMTNSISVSVSEDITKLFENYHKLCDTLREKSAANGAKKGGKTSSVSSKTPRSLMSQKCAVKFLQLLFKDENPQHQDSIAVFHDRPGFVEYIINVSNQKLQQLVDRGRCDGAEGQNKEKVYQYCCLIAGIYMSHYSQKLQSGETVDKLLTNAMLDGLHNAFKYISIQQSEKIDTFLESMVTIKENENTVYNMIKKIQQLIINILSSDDHHGHLKDVVSLLNIVNLLVHQLPVSSENYTKITEWLKKISTNRSIEDGPVVKRLLQQYFTMLSKSSNVLVVLRDVAQDVHSLCGDIDQEIELEERTHYSVVNQKTAVPTVILLVLSQLDKELDYSDWVLNSLKSSLTLMTTTKNAVLGDNSQDEETGPTQRETQERSLCGRLGTLTTVFHELCQSTLPTGLTIETLLKTITHLYNTLGLMAKYYLMMYTQKLGHFSVRFEKLVKLTGTHLTQLIYAFITYAQLSQSEQIQADGKDKKKSAAGTSGSAKIIKERKYIPNLIFSIEQYEKFLIQLTKKSKVDLMEHIKLSTSRDFRINTAALNEALEEQSSSSDDTDGDSDGSEKENDSTQNAPAAKTAAPRGTANTSTAVKEPPKKKSKLQIKGKSKVKKT